VQHALFFPARWCVRRCGSSLNAVCRGVDGRRSDRREPLLQHARDWHDESNTPAQSIVPGTKVCRTCGRPWDNWSDRSVRATESSGNKKRWGQGSDFTREDRAVRYREWHATLGKGFYANDADQVEWRDTGPRARPVATIELSRVDRFPLRSPFGYRADALRRITERDSQRFYAMTIAKALSTLAASIPGADPSISVDAFFVLFHADLSLFHVFNLSKNLGWWEMNKEGYALFLKRLGCKITNAERAMFRAMFVGVDDPARVAP